jgi:hypothetical protein
MVPTLPVRLHRCRRRRSAHTVLLAEHWVQRWGGARAWAGGGTRPRLRAWRAVRGRCRHRSQGSSGSSSAMWAEAAIISPTRLVMARSLSPCCWLVGPHHLLAGSDGVGGARRTVSRPGSVRVVHVVARPVKAQHHAFGSPGVGVDALTRHVPGSHGQVKARLARGWLHAGITTRLVPGSRLGSPLRIGSRLVYIGRGCVGARLVQHLDHPAPGSCSACGPRPLSVTVLVACISVSGILSSGAALGVLRPALRRHGLLVGSYALSLGVYGMVSAAAWWV